MGEIGRCTSVVGKPLNETAGKLVPNERAVEVDKFETIDHALRGSPRSRSFSGPLEYKGRSHLGDSRPDGVFACARCGC